MSSYQNISGTSKPTFRIGPGGVVLSTNDIVVNETTMETIQTLMINDTGAVLTDDNLYLRVASQFCTRVDDKSDPEKVIFYFKYFDKANNKWKETSLPINKVSQGAGTGNISYDGESGSVSDGEFVVFDGTSGRKIRGTGLSKVDEMFKNEYDEDGFKIPIDGINTKIPTAQAVVNYIGSVERPLSERLGGIGATIRQ